MEAAVDANCLTKAAAALLLAADCCKVATGHAVVLAIRAVRVRVNPAAGSRATKDVLDIRAKADATVRVPILAAAVCLIIPFALTVGVATIVTPTLAEKAA